MVNEPQGRAGLVPGQRRPERQGHLRLRDHGARRNVAIGNGRLLSSITDGGKTTWRWHEDSPMASYLTTATNGDFDLTHPDRAERLPIYSAVDSRGDSLATNGFSATQSDDRRAHRRAAGDHRS